MNPGRELLSSVPFPLSLHGFTVITDGETAAAGAAVDAPTKSAARAASFICITSLDGVFAAHIIVSDHSSSPAVVAAAAAAAVAGPLIPTRTLFCLFLLPSAIIAASLSRSQVHLFPGLPAPLVAPACFQSKIYRVNDFPALFSCLFSLLCSLPPLTLSLSPSVHSLSLSCYALVIRPLPSFFLQPLLSINAPAQLPDQDSLSMSGAMTQPATQAATAAAAAAGGRVRESGRVVA